MPTNASIHTVVATNLTKNLDKRDVVQDISFEVEPGTIFGLIGPSGSGKTTTMRMLNGVYRPTKGSVRVFGRDPNRFKAAHRERVGYLPQHFVLYPDLTVMENLNFVAGLYGVILGRFNHRSREVLDFVELWDDRNKRASALSGGMQRRLGLAASLLHEPDLLFVDEPTAGVDPLLRDKFWNGFRALREEGKTIFFTTQYVTEAEYCDRLAVLREGRLVSVGTPADIRRLATGGELVELASPGLTRARLTRVAGLPGVHDVKLLEADVAQLVVEDADRDLPVLRRALEDAGAEVERLERRQMNFDEVFVRLMERSEQEYDRAA